MSVIEGSANHPSLLEMVGTLSSYLLIVVRLQHGVKFIEYPDTKLLQAVGERK